MKLAINTTIDFIISDSQKDNTMKLINAITGGSSKDFDTASQNPSTTLFNDFSVKEIERKDFELNNLNVFDLDIFTKLRTPPEDMCFIHVFCYEASDTQKSNPLRFSVNIKTGTGNLDLGKMSQLSLFNIKESLITGLTISDIVVPNVPNSNPNKIAILSIVVGSNYQYLS
jgi:hypothetical protein